MLYKLIKSFDRLTLTVDRPSMKENVYVFSNIERTSNIEHRTSNIKQQTTNNEQNMEKHSITHVTTGGVGVVCGLCHAKVSQNST
jgi:hypothetical protein